MEQAEKKNPHEGHRERFKERFLKEGLDAFADHEVLELLLYFGIARRDTNLLSHQLLEHFGTLQQVFEANYEQLRAVPGMTASAAVLLHMVPALSRRYFHAISDTAGAMDSTDKIGRFLVGQFMGQAEEEICLLCLDNNCRLLRADTLAEGGLSGFEVSARQIVEIAFQCKAVNLILAHNHPHGPVRPTSQDIRNTQVLAPVLQRLGMELLDHFIVSGEDFVSMMELGYLGVKKVRDKSIHP